MRLLSPNLCGESKSLAWEGTLLQAVKPSCVMNTQGSLLFLWVNQYANTDGLKSSRSALRSSRTEIRVVFSLFYYKSLE